MHDRAMLVTVLLVTEDEERISGGRAKRDLADRERFTDVASMPWNVIP
jgi:hypothetical protein